MISERFNQLDSIVDWDDFKLILKVIYQKKRKSNAGRKPWDTVLDSKTPWLFREQLAQHDLVEKLFDAFDQQLWYSGFIPKGGQIIDASLVNVPKNRNKRDENKAIKEGKTPEGLG